MKVAVQLVTWNGAQYLDTLVASLQQQSYSDWELVVLDNGSTDGTVNQIEKNKTKITKPVQIFLEKSNSGFAPAHVKLFEKSHSEYVLVLNQDTVLEATMLADLVGYMDAHTEVASVSPRVMRLENGVKTNIIDSLGIAINKSRHVVDRGAGKQWEEKNKQSESVFGVSGAVALYRRSALERVGFFDPAYFAYKEDVDLAWRLILAGYKNDIVFGAIAYHARTARAESFVHKIKQPNTVRFHSYKNHLATLYKNEQCMNFLIDFPFIVWYEMRKFVYLVTFDWQALGGLRTLVKNFTMLRVQREAVQKNAVISWRQMRQWFSVK